MKVGFAVVGLGSIAQGSVLPAFANSKRAKLVALVSRDKKKAQRLARKFKVKSAYSSDEYAACLANPEVAAVYIATPQGEHETLTVKAAEAGKYVLCEKPLAATVEQSAQMVKACRQHGVLLMTAYRKYFEPSTLYLKKLIREGYQGCLIRFRPIIMTTMAALLGAVPIAVGYGAGGEARQPLGLVVVGGLIFSQLVTLYLTPVFYTYMAGLQEKIHSRKRKEVLAGY